MHVANGGEWNADTGAPTPGDLVGPCCFIPAGTPNEQSSQSHCRMALLAAELDNDGETLPDVMSLVGDGRIPTLRGVCWR